MVFLVPLHKDLLIACQSKSTANQIAKSVSLAELERAILNLQSAATAIKIREAKRHAKSRNLSIRKIKALMKKMGISAEELQNDKPGAPTRRPSSSKRAATKKKRGPKTGTKVPPKYELKTRGGRHQWTGRGRMPVVFREYVERGGSLEKCLIK